MTEFSTPLLVTKLHIPSIRSRWVERQGLLERLMSQPDARLVLLSAPPGYGKTSLLADWSRLLAARVAWLSLEENDNDPLRFWTYVISAFQLLTGCLRLGENLLSQLHLPEPPPLTNILALLINELSSVHDELVLILDDYHTITHPEIHASLVFLLNHMPPQLRVVIASRTTPALPLARMRARGRVLELHAEDLRFSPEESAQFLTRVMGLEISAEDAAALDLRTEGWAAGLQLAALSFHRESTAGASAASVQHFGGDDRYVLDYLTEEVLERQPPAVQEFLLKTSILTRFSGALCAAVLADSPSAMQPEEASEASQATLDDLEAANLFVVSLDQQCCWFRYHHLFADLLRHQLERQSPQLVPMLHYRAAVWFEAQGLIDEAIQHARLAGPVSPEGLAASDLVAHLVERHYTENIARFDCAPLVHWLSYIPEERILASPALCLAQAWTYLFQIRNERCNFWLDKADAVMPSVTDAEALSELRGQAAAIRSTVAIGLGEHEQALAYAHQALDGLSIKVDLLRALLYLNIGDAYMDRDFEISAQALREAIRLSRALPHPGFTMICTGSLVNLYSSFGRLREALQIYQDSYEIENEWVRQGGRPLPEAGKLLGIYANILYQLNDLENARSFAMESILRCEEWGHAEHILDARLALVRAEQALGHPAEANAALAQARITLEKYLSRVRSRSTFAQDRYAPAPDAGGKKLQRSINNVDYQEATLALFQGRLEDVERWAAAKDMPTRLTQAVANDKVLYAWLLLRRGQSQAAVPLLESAAADFETRGYSLLLTRALALLACGRQECGQPEAALDTLARAVTLAEGEGYLRAFLDIGLPLVGLLEQLPQRLDASSGAHAFLAKLGLLLNVGPVKSPDRPSAAVHLVEALTEREMDVLRLLAVGRSNIEIAAALYVSVNTIKTHVRHLYEKLDATNRVDLAEKSRRLGII